MSEQEDMANQDVDLMDDFAEIRDNEIRMHAEEEARQLEGAQDQIAESDFWPDDLDDDEE